MKIKVKYLQHLLTGLVAKHDVVNERRGYEEICENLGITREYLYKKIANPISKLKQSDTLGLRDGNMAVLLKDLGFKTVNAFIDSVDHPVHDHVKSLIGTYYTYVRRNTKEGVLLRSPVRIYEKDRKVFMTLKGERLTYTGEVNMTKGTLSVLLKHNEGKCFHHIYKIGEIEQPKVLQGIFSGITSGFDPIGGRVVLARVDEAFDSLKTAALDVAALNRKGRLKSDQLLANYFKTYGGNNLKIGKTTTFTFHDLE